MKQKNNLGYQIEFVFGVGVKTGKQFVRRLLDKLIQKKAIYLGKAVLVNYEIYNQKIPNSKIGYLDISEVKRRYIQQIKNFCLHQEVDGGSVRDNLLFIEKECSDYLFYKKNLELLDIGCGSGLYSKILGRKGSLTADWKYSGTEINQNFIQVCQQYFPKNNFFLSTSDKIKSCTNNYDVVFSNSVLHYTLNSWKESLLEMCRVSRNYIIITRFPLTKYNKTFYVKQTVKSLTGTEVHHFICVNRTEFEEFLSQHDIVILKRDYSSEEYNISGIDEKIILAQYLLKKING